MNWIRDRRSALNYPAAWPYRYYGLISGVSLVVLAGGLLGHRLALNAAPTDPSAVPVGVARPSLAVVAQSLQPLLPRFNDVALHNQINHHIAEVLAAYQEPPESFAAVDNLAAGEQAPPLPTEFQLTIDDVLEMRVALAKGVGALTVGVSSDGIAIAEGQTLAIAPGSDYSVQVQGSGIAFNGTTMPDTMWVEPIGGGHLWLGDRPYRGRLLIVNAGGSLYAVNYVLLRDYLYGVVGAEVSPSWELAAIKAQAVAARSYALTHNIRPANRLYDLDDTPRFQAYGGIQKEAPSINQAVNETAGEFISDQGGIVESLYAASEHIVQTVHGGRGMSQLGALALAEQGQSYTSILGTYYPGTAIARLDVDAE